MEDVKKTIRKIRSNYEIKPVSEFRRNFLKEVEFSIFENFLLNRVCTFIIGYAGNEEYYLGTIEFNGVKEEYKKYFIEFIKEFYNYYIMEEKRNNFYKKIFEKAFNIKGE